LVPAGFKSDLASIPRPIWPIIAPFELSIAATLVHDMLYRSSGKSGDITMSREDVDLLFYTILIYDGVPKWKALAAYYSVRLFGKVPWNRYKK